MFLIILPALVTFAIRGRRSGAGPPAPPESLYYPLLYYPCQRRRKGGGVSAENPLIHSGISWRLAPRGG